MSKLLTQRQDYFVTVLKSKDDLFNILMLNNSLIKNHSQHRLLCYVPDNIFKTETEILKNNNILYVNIHREQFRENDFPILYNIYDTIVCANKLVYVDNNLCPICNVDELFNYPAGSSLSTKDADGRILSDISLFVALPFHSLRSLIRFCCKNGCNDSDVVKSIYNMNMCCEDRIIPDIFNVDISNKHLETAKILNLSILNDLDTETKLHIINNNEYLKNYTDFKLK